MKKFLLLALCASLLGSYAFAGDDESTENRNEKTLTVKQSTCVKEVIKIAKAIGFIDKNRPADIIRSVEVYSESAGGFETKEEHIYAGDSELVIYMYPNFYGDGKCQYNSSYLYRD